MEQRHNGALLVFIRAPPTMLLKQVFYGVCAWVCAQKKLKKLLTRN